MKNKFFIIIFVVSLFSRLIAEEINIEAKNITIDKSESYDHDNDINKFLNYQKPQLSFILKRFMVFFFGIRFLNIFLFLFNLVNKKTPSFERKNIISYQAMDIINKNIKNAKTQIEKQIYNGQEILKNIKENHIIYTNSVYSKVIISFAEKKKLDIFKKKLYNLFFRSSWTWSKQTFI